MGRWQRVVLISTAFAWVTAQGKAQTPFALGFAEPRGDAQTESTYQRGTAALDARQWQQAVDAFGAVQRDSPRADGALYWKAYALNKLGRRQDALSALAELQKSFPKSRWINDAKVLEADVRQASGQRISPEAASDDEMKLLALNSLMNSDPDKAIPFLEKFLKGNSPPKQKEHALFVLMQTGAPRARDVVAGIARGNANPDLQMKALEDLSLFGGPECHQILADIYASSNDLRIKRKILEVFMIGGDHAHLLAAAKSEANLELRHKAIEQLGIIGGNSSELLALYSGARDKSDRGAVVQALYLQGNAKTLVDLARKESDPEMKRVIVQQLSLMDDKESTEYMMEILNQ